MNHSLCVRILIGVFLLIAEQSQAGIAPENVCIVVNGESDASQTVADEYSRLRGIPANNVVTVTGISSTEKITVDEFRKRVLGPVLKTLADRKLLPQIDLIAYSAELPTAIDVRGDLGDRKLPKVLTPVASINGLTFLYQLVMNKDIRYLDLNANLYARRVISDPRDTPWTIADQQRYIAGVAALQGISQKFQQPDDEVPPSEEELTAARLQRQQILALLDELLKGHPHSSQLHFNRACVLTLLEQYDDAVTALKTAVESGWWDAQRALQDNDLKPLHDRAEFKALLNDMRAVDFDIQPTTGFRSATGWLPNGNASNHPRAPRYMLSTVLACTTGRGLTVEESLDVLRHSAKADGSRPEGTIYFERNTDVRSTTREWAFRNAAKELNSLGVKTVIEDGVLPKSRIDVAGAVIGTANFDWTKSESTILPGAIVEHLTSFGGAMASSAGQTPLTEFLKHGAAGASGTVTEPYAIQAKFPSPYVQVHYVRGCTLAESFYQSVTGPYQLLIVGDPLAQPWKQDFEVNEAGLPIDSPLSGDVMISPKATSSAGIEPAEVELYVDGLREMTTKADQSLSWDTRKHMDGEHLVTLIVRGSDAIQSIARIQVNATIQNAD